VEDYFIIWILPHFTISGTDNLDGDLASVFFFGAWKVKYGF
jgi:hypothetical protein